MSNSTLRRSRPRARLLAPALFIPLAVGCAAASGAADDGDGAATTADLTGTVARPPHLPPLFDTCTAYVSTTGSDGAAGDRAHPFATLERARDYVRSIKGKVKGPIDVCLRGGVYPLTRTFVLGAEDSGTASAPITYRSYAGEHAVLSGGQKLALQWRPYAPGVYVAKTTAEFNSLFVNDKRAVRARTPNGEATFTMGPNGAHDRHSFPFAPGSLPAGLVDSDIEVVSLARFVAPRQTIRSTTATTATVNGAAYEYYDYAYSGQDRYYVENTLSAVDSPGEWYLDKAAHELYYWPTSASELRGSFVVPRLHQLVNGGSYSENGVQSPVYGETCREVDVEPRNPAALSFGRASFTVASWVRFPAAPANPFWAFTKGYPWGNDNATGVGGNGYGLGMYSTADTVPVQFFVNDGTHRISANVPAQPRGSWIHLAFVVDRASGRMKGYVNGAQVDDANIAALGSIDTKLPLDIGGNGGIGCSNTTMSDFRLYSAALDPAQVAAMAAGSPPSAGLELDIPFDGEARDASPLARDVVAFHAPVFTAAASGRRGADFSLSTPTDASRGVDHVGFADLGFEVSDWSMPHTGYPGSQGAINWTSPAAVHLHGHDVRVTGSVFRHVGSHALSGMLAGGAVKGNAFTDIGGSAIAIGQTSNSGLEQTTLAELSSGNEIRGNRVDTVGVVARDSAAILVMQGENNVITQNTITKAPHIGISVGWFNGDEFAHGGGNQITLNRIDHVVELLNDGSGIYVTGNQPGTVVERNVIHDVLKTPAHASDMYIWGIYVDGTSKHVLVRKNLTYRTQGGGLMLNAAYEGDPPQRTNHDNVAINNIFVDGVSSQLFLNHASLDTFQRNIIYSRRAPSSPFFAVNAADAIMTSGQNMFFSADSAALASELATWKGFGFDADAIVADPMFADYAHDDFRLLPGSKALLPVGAGGIGFEPIDFTGLP